MLRLLAFVLALAIPGLAAAQQPCTPDARRVVNELYRAMLERSAGSAADPMVQRLASGTASVRDLGYEIVTSPEYAQRFVNRGNSEADRRATVTALYRHILGRQPDPGGLQAQMDGVRTQGVNVVIDAMFNSDEYRQRFGDDVVPGTQIRYCGASLDTSNRVAPRFRNMDSNRDGRITRSEWQGTAWTFATIDRNADGVLTADEVRGAGDNGAVGTSGTFGGDDSAERFEAMDRNGNGRIERREWNGSAAEFDRLDTNRNNLLSRAEVSAGGAGSDAFDSLDTNRDGRLTIQEWNWNRRSFEQQDSDGDGAISRWEFTGPPRTRTGF